jgi:hypothetical protein
MNSVQYAAGDRIGVPAGEWMALIDAIDIINSDRHNKTSIQDGDGAAEQKHPSPR